MDSHARVASPFSIPSLDGVRAVSFLIVFLGHVGVPGVPAGFGVTVFFFLSGYLITTLLRREREKTGEISLRLFYLRRVLRILPPFYAILLLALALTALAILPGEVDWPSFFAQACHYSNYWIVYEGWNGMLPGTGVYWSLAVEEHFYLAFPALYLLLSRLGASARAQRSVLLSLCGVTLLWRLVLVLVFDASGDRTYLASDTRFDSMLFGCAMAVAGNPALDYERRPKPSRAELVWLGGGLLLLLASFVVRNDVFRETARYTLQGLGLYPLFFVAVRYPGWGPFRPLNHRMLAFAGTLSYSLYLVHQIMIKLVYHWVSAPEIVQATLSLLASAGVSLLVWHTIEKPCTALRRRLASEGTAPRVAPSATTT